jgi:hypothetical protein
MPEPDDSAFFSNLAAGVSEEPVTRVAEGFGPPVISLERLDAPLAPRPAARYRLRYSP